MLYNFEFKTTQDSSFLRPKHWKACLLLGFLLVLCWYRAILVFINYDIISGIFFCIVPMILTIAWPFTLISRIQLPAKVFVNFQQDHLIVKIVRTNRKGKEKPIYDIYTIKYEDIKLMDFMSDISAFKIEASMSILQVIGFWKSTKYFTKPNTGFCIFYINPGEALELGIRLEEVSGKIAAGIRSSDILKISLDELKSTRELFTCSRYSEHKLHHEFCSTMFSKTLLPKYWLPYLLVYSLSLYAKLYVLWYFVVYYDFRFLMSMLALICSKLSRFLLTFKHTSPCETTIDLLPNYFKCQEIKVGSSVQKSTIRTVDYGSITKIAYSPRNQKLKLTCTTIETYKKGNREKITQLTNETQVFILNSEVGPSIADTISNRTGLKIDDLI